MEVTFKDNSEMSMEEQIDVRHRVIEGLNQINQGNTKDFNAVCDRLEKKYLNAAI